MPLGRWLAALLAVLVAPVAIAQTPYSDDELIGGFMATVFGAESPARRSDGVRVADSFVKKFVGPVDVFVADVASVNRQSTVSRFLANLNHSIANLSLRETADIDEAEIVVYLVDRVHYAPTIRATVWDGVDIAFLESNACSAVIAARRSGIERAVIYIVADEGFVGFSHCLVEEFAQSLGPANDSYLLPDSIFNDASSLNVLGVFDWFILNMLYDARVRPGMSETEVQPLLPAVLADARRRLPKVLQTVPALNAHQLSLDRSQD